MVAFSLLFVALSVGGVSSAATGFVSPSAELFSPLVSQKVLKTALSLTSPPQYPQYTDRTEGDWIWFSPDQWTAGFFPSTLYAMHERTKLCGSSAGSASQWLTLGRAWSTGEIPLETHTGVGHDVGFLSYPFMDELKVNPRNTTAIEAVNKFATALAARFSPIVGCTRSWDAADPTDFQVIIDNMMNLEVLFASEALTGNHTLRDIAISHADKTMVNHIRADGGSFHVVDYNSTTGAVIRQRTSQGYADNSTWSRGEAWGIYGFANMFKHTRQFDYLQTARKMAKYWITNTPSDGIIPWDFNAPVVPPRPADSSAATIAASALLLLADQELSILNITGSVYYTNEVIKMLNANTKLAWRPEWQSLLANGTVNNPVQNNLTGIVYGDYFFIKAGNELVSRGLTRC
ncbi:d-4,5 unsaturated-glucuronyl hydrolase-like protein [Trametes versicolor FP-101664 SS1]|uniref:d-4,5 unsaturated-glucuronyl hydrolase-like protein n=1 Tax=Trametes versicolor (strain FP-101664) TaxID=717944 RepID=UPI00046221DE|nr:d-4,5 unsaturated-glucuronyl hydrolase-like protein [Trametes versicolor FP-101664 SS1]EIW60767.1 d-4,5 unsaturated-glucuronyl hydrolase-like protein [Trametes versicolor FP-101664 SS1]